MQNILSRIHDKITDGNILVLPPDLSGLPSNHDASLVSLYPGEDFGEKANGKSIPRHKAAILSWAIANAKTFRAMTADLRDRITMSLVAREAQLSCGIGNGLALPHCMTALIDDDIELVIVVSPQPLQWYSIDGSLTGILMIALFKANTQDAVSKRMQYSVVLARLFRETNLISELAGQQDPGTIATTIHRHLRELDE